jgi:D-lactate dehydrogenase
MHVLAHDPFPSIEWAAANSVTYRPLAEVLGESDVLSLHLPLSPTTHHLIDAAAIAQMKPGAILVNTSRGKLLDTAAVISALKTGQLAGVALDVYEEEEGVFFEDLSGTVLQDDKLARLLVFPNVLITAHQAFLTREALAEIARVTVTNLAAGPGGFLAGTVVE